MVTHHWDHFIIVSHLTCWSLLSPSSSQASAPSEVVPTACSTANQDAQTKQACSSRLFPYIQHDHNRASLFQIPPPFSLDHSPVSFSHIAGCSHLTSPRTPSPSHHRNHQRAALKFPRYMPQWRVLYIPAESDRHTDNPLQPSPLMP